MLDYSVLQMRKIRREKRLCSGHFHWGKIPEILRATIEWNGNLQARIQEKGFQNLGKPYEVVYWRNLKTPDLRFSVDGKRFED